MFSPEVRFDRQVRLFGASGQAILGNCRVAIIGLGGVGILSLNIWAALAWASSF
jgi:tRNA A37 threonylcarbamoyladenosine dehydratase